MTRERDILIDLSHGHTRANDQSENAMHEIIILKYDNIHWYSVEEIQQFIHQPKIIFFEGNVIEEYVLQISLTTMA